MNYANRDKQHGALRDFIFSVEDTGIGIPENQLDGTFDAFAQVKRKVVPKTGGTGLGLAITRRLIKMMNGSIAVHSKVGKGTRFDVLLRDVEKASVDLLKSDASSDVDLDAVRFVRSSVLLVDDIEYNRKPLRDMLEDQEFSFFEAENGSEALDSVRRQRPDVIRLDMRMPVMSGYEIIDALRSDKRTEDIPIIAVTASAMKEDSERIKKMGISYLRKPFSKSDLLKVLMEKVRFEYESESKGPRESVGKEQLDIQSLRAAPELTSSLVKYRAQCEILSEIMAIDKIEEFSQELLALGKRHQHPPLLEFASDLYGAVERFCIEKIRKLLAPGTVEADHC